jgi:hypothetical protein
VLLYTHAERQLRVARREADAYAWRLADLRRKARETYEQMRARLKLMRRRLRLFEGALRSRDVVLARLKHEAELGRALAGADKTMETIVTRALGAEAWEAIRAVRNDSIRRKLAARIRAAGQAAKRKEKAARVTAASAADSDTHDRQRGLSTPPSTADATADVEPSSNEVSHHGQ